MKIYKLASISEVATIGPLYHGTPYEFKQLEFRDHVLFASEQYKFAYDYARQKSQEGRMDANATVYSMNVSGKVFDPKNEQDLEYFASYMPDTIKCTGLMYQSAVLDKEKWKSYMRGEVLNRAQFSEEDLKGKVQGDLLPDNDVYSKPNSYILLDIDNEKVTYCDADLIYNLSGGRSSGYIGRQRGKYPIDIRTVVKDYLAHSNDHSFWLKPPYYALEFRGSKPIYKAGRGDKMSYNNDNWIFFEGSDCLEIARKIGYDICKIQEKGKVTYAIFDTAKLSNLQKIKN